jgi:hypothetical protein
MTTFTYQEIRKEIDGNQQQVIQYDKAFTSLSWNGNSLLTDLVQNVWSKIKSNQDLQLGSVDSGNCLVLNDGPYSYKCEYTDANAYARLFKMDCSMYVDMSGTEKEVEIRMCYINAESGLTFYMDPFAKLSGASKVSCSSSVLFKLYNNDQVFFEIRNLTNDEGVILSNISIVVTEI